MSCELCDLTIRGNVITKKYYEDKECIIVDCKNCRIPMLVLKKHEETIPIGRAVELNRLLKKVCGEGIIRYPRKIKEHWHIHLMRV